MLPSSGTRSWSQSPDRASGKLTNDWFPIGVEHRHLAEIERAHRLLDLRQIADDDPGERFRVNQPARRLIHHGWRERIEVADEVVPVAVLEPEGDDLAIGSCDLARGFVAARQGDRNAVPGELELGSVGFARADHVAQLLADLDHGLGGLVGLYAGSGTEGALAHGIGDARAGSV